MITNLDEAIKHCEEIAETQEWMANGYDDGSMGKKLGLECASEHRQLASWLKELKAYREQLPHEIKETKKRQARTLEVNVANEVYNPYLSEFVKGYICALSFVEGIVANIIEEVNADADKGVLEKIRAEIEALSNANPSYTHTCDVVDREAVLDIIDKYIEGSESE